jgi:catalase
MPASPALQIIGKMKGILLGRSIGILIADGSDISTINAIKKAVIDAGASVKIVAPKIGGAKLSDGSLIKVDGQLAGTPSVLFDAVAIILSSEGAKELSTEAAAIDFIRDAFGHLKAIAIDNGGVMLLKAANLREDSGVIDALEVEAFIAAAKTRQWERESAVRAQP